MMGRFATLLEQVARGGVEVRADSRQVGPGDGFVAVPGATEDGARFIPAARERPPSSARRRPPLPVRTARPAG